MEVADYCGLDFDLEAIIPVLVDLEDNMLDRCKKNFFTFLVTFFTFLTFFYFPNVFLLLKKNVGKIQSGKQINKKHFQNNSNKIDL